MWKTTNRDATRRYQSQRYFADGVAGGPASPDLMGERVRRTGRPPTAVRAAMSVAVRLADLSDLFIYVDAFLHRKSLARGARWRQSRDAGLYRGGPSSQA